MLLTNQFIQLKLNTKTPFHQKTLKKRKKTGICDSPQLSQPLTTWLPTTTRGHQSPISELIGCSPPLTQISPHHPQSLPQGQALQPAGFPSICPVNLLIVLIKETRKRRRSDTSVELWGSCLRRSLLLMGDHRGGGVSQWGPQPGSMFACVWMGV